MYTKDLEIYKLQIIAKYINITNYENSWKSKLKSEIFEP